MSDKALLVMDMPECFSDCFFCFEFLQGAGCTIISEPGSDHLWREIKEDYCQCKPDWCPMREIPQRKTVIGIDGVSGIRERILHAKQVGWNACIDKILEGCKDEIN